MAAPALFQPGRSAGITQATRPGVAYHGCHPPPCVAATPFCAMPTSVPQAQPVPAPRGSRIERRLAGAHFHDAWAMPAARPELDALGQFLRVARSTPGWIEAAMALRNRLVGLVGLKNLGGLSQIAADRPAASYRPGERVGIFTLIENGADEALLGDSDKHLDVVLSVHRRAEAADASQVTITVTTVVHVKNWLGRLYMLPVKPAHRVIARRMTSAIGRR